MPKDLKDKVKMPEAEDMDVAPVEEDMEAMPGEEMEMSAEELAAEYPLELLEEAVALAREEEPAEEEMPEEEGMEPEEEEELMA